jgi:hypothetical protein
MKFDIPQALREEHDELHAMLERATREQGAVGEAARGVARVLHPHFVREEEFALPPLALLAQVSAGSVRPEMAAVVPLAKRLQSELPAMLAEHKEIVAALEKLAAAAHAAALPEYERFAEVLVRHARTEEQITYPAALVVGKYVARSLGMDPF